VISFQSFRLKPHRVCASLSKIFTKKVRQNTNTKQWRTCKGKVHPRTAHEAPGGGGRGTALLFLNLGGKRGWVVNATPRPLYPREPSGTHCIGGWVGPRAGQDGCRKSRPPPEFDPRTVQPVASRYTDWVIPARRIGSFVKFCAFMTYIWKICVKNYTGVNFLNAQQHRRVYKLDEQFYNNIETRLPCTEYTLHLWRWKKGKAISVLNSTLYHNDVWRSRGADPFIADLRSNCTQCREIRLQGRRKGNIGSIPIWNKRFFYYPKSPTECVTRVKRAAREAGHSPPTGPKGGTWLSCVSMECMRALLTALCWRVYVALHKQMFYKRYLASDITDGCAWR
jgi:hypothetical protein